MIKECGRVLKECLNRKDTLAKMLEESRAWDSLSSAINLWLTDVQERLVFLCILQFKGSRKCPITEWKAVCEYAIWRNFLNFRLRQQHRPIFSEMIKYSVVC